MYSSTIANDMRKQLLLLIAIISQSCAQSSQKQIDRVNSDEQVLDLMNIQFPPSRGEKPISFTPYREEWRAMADSLGIKPWEKYDMDGDGDLELIVFHASPGFYALTFFADGDSLKTATPYFNKEAVVFPVRASVSGHPVLLWHHTPTAEAVSPGRNQRRLECDTLVFRKGYFQEYNPRPSFPDPAFLSVTITPAETCMMDCVTTEMTIDFIKETGTCVRTLKGGASAKGSLSPQQIQKCRDIVSYINLEKLRPQEFNQVRVDCATVEIRYNGGHSHSYKDPGLSGSFSLGLLYNIALYGVETE